MINYVSGFDIKLESYRPQCYLGEYACEYLDEHPGTNKTEQKLIS